MTTVPNLATVTRVTMMMMRLVMPVILMMTTMEGVSDIYAFIIHKNCDDCLCKKILL